MAALRRRLVIAAAGETAGAFARGVGRIKTYVVGFSNIAAVLRRHEYETNVAPMNRLPT
jgi:hypothetical protein